MIHVHLIGIGGTGLSGIAIVLLGDGYTVSGSDQILSPLAQAAQESGAKVYIGHNPDNVIGADLVIRSSAVPDDNVEVRAAKKAGIPILKRSAFLGQLMEGRQGIAIAGTHGKTTTTAMIAWMLTKLKQDPTFVVGGVIRNLKTNARSGTGPFFVIEADEYDHMFLGLQPTIAIVTNVEYDHPDFYPSPQSFHNAFHNFIKRIIPDGILIACGDDQGATQIIQKAANLDLRVFSYGLRNIQYSYYAINLVPLSTGGFTFDVFNGGKHLANFTLRLPGEHNVRNALAAVAVADQLGLPMNETAIAINEFRGVGRRFDIRGEVEGVVVIDDYAHHPTEIQATLSAARTRFPERNLWVVWQPHTFSRTKTLLNGFSKSFEGANHVVITDIYPARETIPSNFSAVHVAEAIEHPDVHLVHNLKDAINFLMQQLEPGDVLLVLSAGDAHEISDHVLEGYQYE
ncbi:MAG: UDP-N-acetylmuramate--L-alanine ligase [Anaerolineales bacterium]|jgi:UDP-N-acetylmuramate--alanine ligase